MFNSVDAELKGVKSFGDKQTSTFAQIVEIKLLQMLLNILFHVIYVR